MINPFIGGASSVRTGVKVFSLSVVTLVLIGASFVCGRSMHAAPRLSNEEDSAAKVISGKSRESWPLGKTDLAEVEALYRQLTDAENAHDSGVVERLVWKSPDALFVSKTATAAEGNWAGVWLDPDYSRLKVVGITREVAETYAPVQISVSYGGQLPVPKPFLIITDWVKTNEGWKMATDIALPVPPSPSESKKQ
jgi:hypothetical protein